MTDVNEYIRLWVEADAARKAWQAREIELRTYLASQFGYNPNVQGSLPDGTHRRDIGNGYKLKLVVGTTYDVKDGEALRMALAAVRDLNDPLPKPLVTFKPTLSKTAYDAAPVHIRAMLEPAVTMKNKAPVLELETP